MFDKSVLFFKNLNKVIHPNCMGWFGIILCLSLFFTDRGFSAEFVPTKKVQFSEKDDKKTPYLALSANEIKNLEEDQFPILILRRAGRVCKSRGYHSALNFKLSEGSEEKWLAVVNYAYQEDSIIVDSELKGLSILVDAALFAATGGFITLASLGGRRALVGVASLSVEFGVSYGLHKLTAKELNNVDVENMYSVDYLYFSHIDCLNSPETASLEQIVKWELAYDCSLSHGHDCRDLSLDELYCVSELKDLNLCRKIRADTKQLADMNCVQTRLKNKEDELRVFFRSDLSVYDYQLNFCSPDLKQRCSLVLDLEKDHSLVDATNKCEAFDEAKRDCIAQVGLKMCQNFEEVVQESGFNPDMSCAVSIIKKNINSYSLMLHDYLRENLFSIAGFCSPSVNWANRGMTLEEKKHCGVEIDLKICRNFEEVVQESGFNPDMSCAVSVIKKNIDSYSLMLHDYLRENLFSIAVRLRLITDVSFRSTIIFGKTFFPLRVFVQNHELKQIFKRGVWVP